MDCPSCGRRNASERVECEFCQALLVDVFCAEDDSKTDPMQVIGGGGVSEDTAALLRAAREIPEDDTSPPRDSLPRVPSSIAYTGDLPRLFRFGNRYQILEKLGEGGMGRVYKALDLELDRPVALKTIRAEKGTGPEILDRFKQELILARKITHKNIIRIYDLGESDGMKFFTMELIEGRSLRDVLKEKGKLSVAETLSVMTQMLSGLSEAHEQGVVHRDLKPQNVMVDASGTIRIMDFGIARTADSATMTGTGEMMGTPDYISPEQVRGETADAQSDLYACGVILYELLTGETPFKGDTPISKIVARIQAKPKPPREINPEIPGYLERIILKCLEGDPELRYRSAAEILQDLEREQVDRSLWIRVRKALSRKRGWVAAALLALSSFVGYRYYERLPEPSVAADVPVTTIAVLPFRNMTGAEDLDWMEQGIPELLITDISQLQSLRPVTAERIHQILGELGKDARASELDEESVQVITEMAGADHALYGGFVGSGGSLRFDMSLRDSETGIVRRVKVQGSAGDVFGLVDRVTDEVSAALDVSTEENRPLAEVSTSSLEAFRAYQKGVSELRKGANQAVVAPLSEATRLDPSFTMAYAKLAEAQFLLGDEAGAQQAIEVAEQRSRESPPPLAELYEIHAIAARIAEDPETAVKSYRELKKLYPDDPGILLSLASSLEEAGLPDEAVRAYRDVVARAPQYGAALLGLGRMLVLSGRAAEAIPSLEKALKVSSFHGDPEALGMIHSILGVAHRHLTQYDDAIRELGESLRYRRLAGDERGITASLTNLAILQAMLGRFGEARALLDEGLRIARSAGNSTMESFALVNLGFVHQRAGDLHEALARYRDSLEIEWERNEHTELTDRLNLIGRVYALLGRYADAMVYIEQAQVHIEAASDQQAKAHNLLYLGQIHRDKGDYAAATEELLRSIPLLRDAGELWEVADAYDTLSSIYLEQGRASEALDAVAQSVGTSEALRVPLRVAESRAQEAYCLSELGRVADAEAAMEQAVHALEGLEGAAAGPVGLEVALVRGHLFLERGSLDEAEGVLERTLDRARQTGQFTLTQRARIELGRVLHARGASERAERLVVSMLEPLDRRRLRPLRSVAGIVLAEIYAETARAQPALEELERTIAAAEAFGGSHFVKESRELKRELQLAE